MQRNAWDVSDALEVESIASILILRSNCFVAENPSRKLAAILAADIAGYSALMGAPDTRTSASPERRPIDDASQGITVHSKEDSPWLLSSPCACPTISAGA